MPPAATPSPATPSSAKPFSAKRVLKLTLQYDGTGFVGWQRQAQGTSIQGLLEEALARIEGRAVTVAGAGRTDAGVHALGQVASVLIEHAISTNDLERALNSLLPDAIRVIGVEEADSAFHARFSARSKTYRYLILNRAIGSPFARQYAWHLQRPLQLEPMKEAVPAIRGTHDFAAFQASGGAAASTVRTIFHAELSRVETAASNGLLALSRVEGPGFAGARTGVLNVSDLSDLLVFEISGNGFLRHMVRSLVGTLVEIGVGRRPSHHFSKLLQPSPRADVGATAPAHGLFLVHVDYGAAPPNPPSGERPVT